MSQIKLVRTDSQLSRASESMCADDILVESWKGKAQQQFDLETILNLSQSQGFNETQTQIAETFYSVSPVKRHHSLRLDNPNNQYSERFSPGVNLFQSERGSKFFKYGDIDIESLFDYHPRARLYKRGFTDQRINTILKILMNTMRGVN
ncbi:uncharacterized protein LOC111698190 [Eurytemora carolleeae]|uniref:uncharacterized protein LOC111698190 n=1 Tax=Eurytemora carolleeae TaxID=1294199 RepID=UPI000C77197F|nr:uncharacterized protein LOC111698190 [Eurytemora carolleeae]|eukprot:XP_023324219.1 uncharacterized protein LOC111698190 [Eurytemora affinis]